MLGFDASKIIDEAALVAALFDQLRAQPVVVEIQPGPAGTGYTLRISVGVTK